MKTWKKWGGGGGGEHISEGGNKFPNKYVSLGEQIY